MQRGWKLGKLSSPLPLALLLTPADYTGTSHWPVFHSLYGISWLVCVASYPGPAPFRRKKGLVSTVCAYANFSGKQDSSLYIVGILKTLNVTINGWSLQGLPLLLSASSEDFSSALTFSLGQLKLPSLSLKEEQRAAIKAVYEGKDVCATKLSLLFSHTNRLGQVVLLGHLKLIIRFSSPPASIFTHRFNIIYLDLF